MREEYSFVPKKEMDLIHEYSMRLLEKTGVKFFSEDALDYFRKNGFRVDGDTVYMTEADVRKALETTPKTFEWWGRNGKVTVGDGTPVLGPSYGPVFILEDEQYHMATAKDFTNFLKLVATSPVLNVTNPNLMTNGFIPEEYASNWAMAAALLLDTHPTMGMIDGYKSANDSIKMAQDFLGIYDKPVLNSLVSCSSPCHYSTACCEGLIAYAKAGQAVYITPSSLHGLTCPGSLASLLMLDNAQTLAGIVLSQLVNPGTPVMYGIQSHGCDLRFSTPCTGSAEEYLIWMAAKGMGEYYGLPVRTGGGSCDGKQFDFETGRESFAMLFASLKSGADLIVHVTGNLDSDSSLSYDKFIGDEENVLMIRRMMRGIEVTEENLMFDIIDAVGPGGSFLDADAEDMIDSLEAYKDEFLKLELPFHEGHASWVAAGEPTVQKKADRIWRQRVESYTMPEVTDDQMNVIRQYLPEELIALITD